MAHDLITYFVIDLHIKRACNVDQLIGPFVPPTKSDSDSSSTYYQVIVTDSQNLIEYRTQLVKKGSLNSYVHWGCDLRMVFDESPGNGESLFFEVLQFGRKCDPGTSSGVGVKVVGRARIPVPSKEADFGWQKLSLVTLVGSDKKVDAIMDLCIESKVVQL
ncbi:hypothetical protein ACH5RR_019331 [Cinchona calisaya]|uniref:Uncharacterized protein n=1 Tax=Cinchona calisaya TaxID=153742 RepID=A0ABD2ZRW8_9GENT